MTSRLEVSGYHIVEQRHALAILEGDYSSALDDLRAVLEGFTIPAQTVLAGGGGKSKLTFRLEELLKERGWSKKRFQVDTSLDGVELKTTTHELDHCKTFGEGAPAVALEIEWNNKDPFYDRDLENFARLHRLGAISVGIVITRGPSLEAELAAVFQRSFPDAKVASKKFQSKFGAATTNWRKLQSRIDRQVGNPAPLVLIGIEPPRLT